VFEPAHELLDMLAQLIVDFLVNGTSPEQAGSDAQQLSHALTPA